MTNNTEVYIPPMTHQLGRYWNQPKTEDILIDDLHAVMSHQTFNALTTYSHSIPDGVYPGKMWKAFTDDGRKHLRWFGIVNGRQDVCSYNSREILIVEACNEQ